MKNTAGFTLIELLVVIAIIGILSSVVLASLNGARQSSRDARRQTDLQQIRTGLALYRDQKGKYPADNNLYTELKSSGAMTQVPKDPSTGNKYWYDKNPGNFADFCLGAKLESTSDLPDDNSTQCLSNASLGSANYAISGK